MNLITRNEFLQKNTLFNNSHLNALIRKARAGGYKPEHGIIKKGRSIFINEERLLFWITNTYAFN